MTTRNVGIVFVFLIAGLLACQSGPPQGGQMYTSRDESLAAAHPRLILSPEVAENLQGKLSSSHEWLWTRYRQDIPSRLESAASGKTERLDRGVANSAQELAFIWKMTGNREHFEAARDHLLALAHSDPWPPENDLIHGHLLQGIALAYDWLYPRLSEQERKTVSDRLRQEAESEYQRMTTGRVWYRNQYFQNHGISNFCGLAYAAAALYGEDERAPDWLRICEEFMDIVLETLPPDGTSLEGISYGAYDFEFIIRYVALARTMLDRDYTDTEGLKNFPRWVLHSMLPVQEPTEWAMTFGDAPRHVNWHGPEAQLFWSATNYKDPVAQWLGRHLIELEDEGLGSASWWALLFYADAIPPAGPSDFATFQHFTENDQVMMRSSWLDPDATLVGLKAGPFMGRTLSPQAKWDWGTNHQEPDAGSFQIFSHGAQLAVDPGYTTFKRTANHNTMLFKEQGQLGEDVPWMGVAECVQFRHYPHIVHSATGDGYAYVVADMDRAYHRALNLDGYERHYLYLEPGVLLVADEFSLGADGALHSYPSRIMELSGGLEFGWGGYVVGEQGEASVKFTGTPGEYRIAVNYLDNFPGEGTYRVEVDGRLVHEWQSTNRDSDNHYIITPPAELKTGSRIAFVGRDMPRNCRLIRMAAYSPRASSERSARWLLHAETSATVGLDRDAGMVTIVNGTGALELYAISPDAKAAEISVEDWEIMEPDAEVETTKRISLVPSFDGDRVVLINLLHARAADGAALEGLESSLDSEGDNLKAAVSWRADGGSVSLDWDLRARTVELNIN
ncbi:MAG: DUF4962 domain-containing protein [Candidatus Glassbacteria bacterium]|nr:DUF4962 domain-containing protein [Candidatus Glassbacteria bacterium]